MTFSPNGKLLVMVGVANAPSLWEGKRDGPKLIAYLSGHTGIVTGAAFSHDSKFLVTSSEDGTARIWDISLPQKPLSVAVLQGFEKQDHKGVVSKAVMSREGGRVLVISQDKTARLYTYEVCGTVEDLIILTENRLKQVGEGENSESSSPPSK